MATFERTGEFKAKFGSTQKVSDDYEKLFNHPFMNDREVIGHKTGADYSLQDLLIPGEGIEIEDNGDHTNTIKAIGGDGDKTFEFNQSTPAAEWRISHSLKKYPAVTVVDSGGSVVIGDIEYVDDSNIIITFQAAFAGKAYLN